MGLIVDLGRWILRKACMEAMKWPEAVSVAVNFSPQQFHQCGRQRDRGAGLFVQPPGPRHADTPASERIPCPPPARRGGRRTVALDRLSADLASSQIQSAVDGQKILAFWINPNATTPLHG